MEFDRIYSYQIHPMERAAYQWNTELLVYIDKTCLRCGVGKALYSALIEILQMQNVRNVYGGVNPLTRTVKNSMNTSDLND